jgi:Ca2+/Na+ antiporter
MEESNINLLEIKLEYQNKRKKNFFIFFLSMILFLLVLLTAGVFLFVILVYFLMFKIYNIFNYKSVVLQNKEIVVNGEEHYPVNQIEYKTFSPLRGPTYGVFKYQGEVIAEIYYNFIGGTLIEVSPETVEAYFEASQNLKDNEINPVLKSFNPLQEYEDIHFADKFFILAMVLVFLVPIIVILLIV